MKYISKPTEINYFDCWFFVRIRWTFLDLTPIKNEILRFPPIYPSLFDTLYYDVGRRVMFFGH